MAPDVNLNAKGVFYGASLKHTKGHFIRSIMESLGYIICRNLESIHDMGLNIQQIRTMGGGSKSDLWNQIKADVTGQTLRITGLFSGCGLSGCSYSGWCCNWAVRKRGNGSRVYGAGRKNV